MSPRHDRRRRAARREHEPHDVHPAPEPLDSARASAKWRSILSMLTARGFYSPPSRGSCSAPSFTWISTATIPPPSCTTRPSPRSSGSRSSSPRVDPSCHRSRAHPSRKGPSRAPRSAPLTRSTLTTAGTGHVQFAHGERAANVERPPHRPRRSTRSRWGGGLRNLDRWLFAVDAENYAVSTLSKSGLGGSSTSSATMIRLVARGSASLSK